MSGKRFQSEVLTAEEDPLPENEGGEDDEEEGEEPPGEILCDGMLTISKGSKEDLRYVVLYQHVFEYYNQADDFRLEVSVNGLDGDSAGGNGTYQKTGDRNGRPFYEEIVDGGSFITYTPENQQWCIVSSLDDADSKVWAFFECEQLTPPVGQWTVNSEVAAGDPIVALAKGSDTQPRSSIALDDISSFELEDDCIIVNFKDDKHPSIRFLAPNGQGGQELLAWKNAFDSALDFNARQHDEELEEEEEEIVEEQEQVEDDEVATTAADPAAEPLASAVCHGFVELAAAFSAAEQKYCALYKDRFVFWSSKEEALAGDSPEGSFDVQDIEDLAILSEGCTIQVVGGLEYKLACSSEAELGWNAWLEGFQSVVGGSDAEAQASPFKAAPKENPQQPTREPHISPDSPLTSVQAQTSPSRSLITPEWNVESPTPGANSALATPDLAKELQSTLFMEGLKALKERPVLHGLLGLQHTGRQVTMYCVLFQDRLDCWDRPLNALQHFPDQSILIADVKGVEMISTGFILNCKSRKFGVHVGSNDDLLTWSNALLCVLTDSTQSGSESPRPSKQKPEKSGRRKGKVTKDPTWVPRVAGLALKAERSKQDDGPSRESHGQGKATWTNINTHGRALDAGANCIHGQWALIQPSVDAKMKSNVAGNVNWRVGRNEHPGGMAPKVTGETRTTVLSPRGKATKVLSKTMDPGGEDRKPLSRPNRHAWEVTGKVNTLQGSPGSGQLTRSEWPGKPLINSGGPDGESLTLLRKQDGTANKITGRAPEVEAKSTMKPSSVDKQRGFFSDGRRSP